MTEKQTIPVSRVNDLIHALEECEEHHRAAGDDYMASQWRQAANMARNTLLSPSLEDLSIRDDFDRDDYLWCQAEAGQDMHGVIVGWDDENCPILVTQEGYHGPEYTHLVRPLTHLPRLEWPDVTHVGESVSESDDMSEPETVTEPAGAGECQIEGVANPPYDTGRLYRDRDGDVWEHIDGWWVPGDTHEERVRTVRGGSGLSDLHDIYSPYTPVEDEPDLPRPEDVPAGETWLIREGAGKPFISRRDTQSRLVSAYTWTGWRGGTAIQRSRDSEVTLIRRVEVDQ